MTIIKRIVVLGIGVGIGVAVGTAVARYVEIGFMHRDNIQPYARPQARPSYEPEDGKAPVR